jgi:hypothetical protein
MHERSLKLEHARCLALAQHVVSAAINNKQQVLVEEGRTRRKPPMRISASQKFTAHSGHPLSLRPKVPSLSCQGCRRTGSEEAPRSTLALPHLSQGIHFSVN